MDEALLQYAKVEVFGGDDLHDVAEAQVAEQARALARCRASRAAQPLHLATGSLYCTLKNTELAETALFRDVGSGSSSRAPKAQIPDTSTLHNLYFVLEEITKSNFYPLSDEFLSTN